MENTNTGQMKVKMDIDTYDYIEKHDTLMKPDKTITQDMPIWYAQTYNFQFVIDQSTGLPLTSEIHRIGEPMLYTMCEN